MYIKNLNIKVLRNLFIVNKFKISYKQYFNIFDNY